MFDLDTLEELKVPPGARRTVVIDHPNNMGLIFSTKDAPQIINGFWAKPEDPADPKKVSLQALIFVNMGKLSPELNEQIVQYLKEHPDKPDFRQARFIEQPR